jgi:hypothetical protein
MAWTQAWTGQCIFLPGWVAYPRPLGSSWWRNSSLPVDVLVCRLELHVSLAMTACVCVCQLLGVPRGSQCTWRTPWCQWMFGPTTPKWTWGTWILARHLGVDGIYHRFTNLSWKMTIIDRVWGTQFWDHPWVHGVTRWWGTNEKIGFFDEQAMFEVNAKNAGISVLQLVISSACIGRYPVCFFHATARLVLAALLWSILNWNIHGT